MRCGCVKSLCRSRKQFEAETEVVPRQPSIAATNAGRSSVASVAVAAADVHTAAAAQEQREQDEDEVWELVPSSRGSSNKSSTDQSLARDQECDPDRGSEQRGGSQDMTRRSTILSSCPPVQPSPGRRASASATETAMSRWPQMAESLGRGQIQQLLQSLDEGPTAVCGYNDKRHGKTRSRALSQLSLKTEGLKLPQEMVRKRRNSTGLNSAAKPWCRLSESLSQEQIQQLQEILSVSALKPEYPMSKLPSIKSECFVEPVGVFADPSQTLMFVDWDDTLFPTTHFLDKLKLPAPNPKSFEKDRREWSFSDTGLEDLVEQNAMLEDWQHALQRFLTTACSLSKRCVILTLACPGWVEACINMYAPDLSHFLQHPNLKVVYAREVITKMPRWKKHALVDFSQDYSRAQLTHAKFEAMMQQAKTFYKKNKGQNWKNILSFGDMFYEHDAVQELGMMRQDSAEEKIRIKSLLLPKEASDSELSLRLSFLQVMLPAFVQFDDDLSLNLQGSQDPLAKIADAMHLPHLSDCNFPRHAWGLGPLPEDNISVKRALFHVATLVQAG